MENKMGKLFGEMINAFHIINSLLDSLDFESKDEYKRINRTYFLINKKHYEAFLELIKYQHNPSAFVLSRTILETFVKSCYLEYIEKPKNTSINDFLIEKKKFPSLYSMANELESYTDLSRSKFEGFFNQFLKKELATYEKLSFFSHSNGEYIQSFNEKGSVSFSQEDVFNVMNLMHKMFISNALFHLLVFKYFDEQKLITKIYEKTLNS